MIAILRDQNMGEQSRTGAPALDRQRRHRRLADRFAGPAAHLGPDMHDPLKVRGHVFPHLAPVFADLDENGAAASGAYAPRLMDDLVPRQMLGQRLAAACGGLGLGHGGGFGGAGLLGPRPCFRLAFFEIAEHEFQLRDRAVELFRGPAKPSPPQHGELGFQLLDMERLGVDLRLQQPHQGPQFVGIAGQGRFRQRHDLIYHNIS